MLYGIVGGFSSLKMYSFSSIDNLEMAGILLFKMFESLSIIFHSSFSLQNDEYGICKAFWIVAWSSGYFSRIHLSSLIWFLVYFMFLNEGIILINGHLWVNEIYDFHSARWRFYVAYRIEVQAYWSCHLKFCSDQVHQSIVQYEYLHTFSAGILSYSCYHF